MIGVLVEMIICEILLRVIVSVSNKAFKISKYLDVKNCSCKKSIFGKLAPTHENEILSTIEIELDDRKVTYERNNYLHDSIGDYMLVINSCTFYWLLLML